MKTSQKPCIAIVDANTLMCIGLKAMLEKIGAFMEIKIYNSFEQLEKEEAIVPMVHFFISSRMMIEHLTYFQARQKKTLVFTTDPQTLQSKIPFRILDVSQPEEILVKSLLHIHQMAHHSGYPAIDNHGQPLGHGQMMHLNIEERVSPLSIREVEVLTLVVKGFINKEIAEKLNIGVTTVISHRKNIVEKLGMKSMSALTIYAVTHGYVEVDGI